MPNRDLFRRQAVAAHAARHRRLAGPLEISPRWIRWVEGLLLLVGVSAILFATLGTVGEYAQGTAVVLTPAKNEVLGPTLVAVFPGHYRSVLKPGMPLRLSFQGYGTSHQRLIVDRVEGRPLGPPEVKRLLGADLADTVAFSGPSALAFASLPGKGFEIGAGVLPYHHGLQGTAHVRIRSQRILTSLLSPLPGLSSSDGD